MPTQPDVLTRHHVCTSGRPDGPPIVFVHGFACDGRMWSRIVPAFTVDHHVVVLDQAGAGRAARDTYDPDRHGQLAGYAADLVEIAEGLDLRDALIVGHSFGALVGALAHLQAPGRFGALALLCASPRYLDDPETGYLGGFSRPEIDELLETIDRNFGAWADAMAPAVMNTPDRPELGAELATAMRRTAPDVAAGWARVTFLADIRALVPTIRAPTLVLQCDRDPIVPDHVGHWLARRLPDSTYIKLRATGHCPHLSAPEETADAIRSWQSTSRTACRSLLHA